MAEGPSMDIQAAVARTPKFKPTTDYSDASGVFRNLPVRGKSICRSCCAWPKAAGRNGAYTQSINERGYFTAKTPRREVRKVLQNNDLIALLCVLAP